MSSIIDNEGYRLSNKKNFTPLKYITSNLIDTNNMSVPAIIANGQLLHNNTGTHFIPGNGVLEQPIMKKGGIHIKKSHKGKFTEYKKRTGKTTEEALHSKDPHVRKMAQFSKNAKKWKHQYGGFLNQLGQPQLQSNYGLQNDNSIGAEQNIPNYSQGYLPPNLYGNQQSFQQPMDLYQRSFGTLNKNNIELTGAVTGIGQLIANAADQHRQQSYINQQNDPYSNLIPLSGQSEGVKYGYQRYGGFLSKMQAGGVNKVSISNNNFIYGMQENKKPLFSYKPIEFSTNKFRPLSKPLIRNVDAPQPAKANFAPNNLSPKMDNREEISLPLIGLPQMNIPVVHPQNSPYSFTFRNERGAQESIFFNSEDEYNTALNQNKIYPYDKNFVSGNKEGNSRSSLFYNRPQYKDGGGTNVVVNGKPMYKRKDGKVVKRGLWSNVHLSKKQDGGEMDDEDGADFLWGDEKADEPIISDNDIQQIDQQRLLKKQQRSLLNQQAMAIVDAPYTNTYNMSKDSSQKTADPINANSANYNDNIAAGESGDNYMAKNPTSTAFGKYQFIKGTRLGVYDQSALLKQMYPSKADFEDIFIGNQGLDKAKEAQEATMAEYTKKGEPIHKNDPVAMALYHYAPKFADLYMKGQLDLDKDASYYGVGKASQNPTFRNFLRTHGFKGQFSKGGMI